MLTDRLNKSGTTESNGDVTFDLPRSLLAAATYVRNLNNHKLLKNLQTLEDRRVWL